MATAQNKVFQEKPAGFYSYGSNIHLAIFVLPVLFQFLYLQQLL